MSSSQKTDKRIVSRGEYVWLDLKTLGVGLSGFGLYAAAMVCGLMTVVLAIALFFLVAAGAVETVQRRFHPEFWTSSLLLLVFVPISGALTYALMKLACKGMEYDATRDVIPFTQADTKQLSAPDSLVRASQEPIQAQETVLLRAAQEQEQAPREQLLRAVTEGAE